jgi:flagella basal body P-ring formation protein FlgA
MNPTENLQRRPASFSGRPGRTAGSLSFGYPPAVHQSRKAEAFGWLLSACCGATLLAGPLAAAEPGSAPADNPAPSVSASPVAVPAPALPRERPFAEADLLELLTATLQQEYVKDKGQLELRLAQPWKTRTVPDAPLTLKVVDLPTLGVTPQCVVRFELRTAHESLGTWQTPVQARVWREVWVAHSALQRGELVSDADITRERRDILALREALAEFAAGDAMLALAEPLQAGAPLLARSVKVRPVVHRGQIAEALIQDGALTVSMKVEVLEDGAPGQIIRARNVQSRRDIRGKVLNEQTILLSL